MLQVWSLDSAKPDYTLIEHSDKVKCLAFFKRGDRQYLITGSNDCTAKVYKSLLLDTVLLVANTVCAGMKNL
jgi:WD40 repeat protein